MTEREWRTNVGLGNFPIKTDWVTDETGFYDEHKAHCLYGQTEMVSRQA